MSLELKKIGMRQLNEEDEQLKGSDMQEQTAWKERELELSSELYMLLQLPSMLYV